MYARILNSNLVISISEVSDHASDSHNSIHATIIQSMVDIATYV